METQVTPTRQKPLLSKILMSDILVTLGIGLPLFFVGLMIVLYFFGGVDRAGTRRDIDRESGLPLAGYAALATAVIGWPTAWWRIRRVQEVFEHGAEEQGEITGIAFNKDRGRVKWKYSYNGEIHEGASIITKTATTRNYRVGDKVTLLVHKQDPKRSVIRELFA